MRLARFGLEQARRPECNQNVENTEHEARSNESESRREDQGKKKRDRERTQVVERQDLRDEVLELKLVFQDAQQKRNLESNESADNDDLRVENQPETLQVGKYKKKDCGGRSPNKPYHHLNANEANDESLADIAREVRSDAHGKEVGSDNRRK